MIEIGNWGEDRRPAWVACADMLFAVIIVIAIVPFALLYNLEMRWRGEFR